ncbi:MULTISPECIES: adenosylmethionine decarboxylase [unclassified Janthinobacterium]|uniref:adenosylmethionine decarboxylase n=1 Tax=unclassified Janthinobacterium TaxID=2610881 RepID=UPI0008F5279A|nr:MULTISPECIES: adenosylmethionine decarboxylase [unclassified Janthinobacterium]APA70764.1 S-adenosylmethionine decarboxylase [Janthinobacterium sp. 1_2014MBL_MicDiv]MDN2711407.1 adenosylmethionine decarboxylase [Janthinobacterium sp. SUN118]
MAETPHLPLGTHLLADLSGISADRLRDCDALERLLRQAAVTAGAQVLHSHFHSFGAGQGVTGVVLLAESHISLHTWPEVGFAAVDIFMCGAARPQLALDVVKEALQAAQCQLQSVRRAPPGQA